MTSATYIELSETLGPIKAMALSEVCRISEVEYTDLDVPKVLEVDLDPGHYTLGVGRGKNAIRSAWEATDGGRWI